MAAFILLLALHSSCFCAHRQPGESEQETDAAENQTDQKKRLLFFFHPDRFLIQLSVRLYSQHCTRNAKGRSDSGTIPSGNSPHLSSLKLKVKTFMFIVNCYSSIQISGYFQQS